MEQSLSLSGLLMLDFKVRSLFVIVIRCLTILLELDIETGRLLFEWRSLDHVLPDGTLCS